VIVPTAMSRMRGVIVHIMGVIIHWSLVRAAFAMMNVIVSHGTSAIYVSRLSGAVSRPSTWPETKSMDPK
jgi:hypothetical protein